MVLRAGPRLLPADSPSEYLAEADALGPVLRWLAAHPRVLAALGGADRVGPYNKPPFPRLRVLQVPGGQPGLWLAEQHFTLEALGDLDGSTSPAALSRVLRIAYGALVELPGQPAEPGEVVITDVSPRGGWGPVPMPQGQRRYLTTVGVTYHPAQ